MPAFQDLGDAECCICLPARHGVALIATGMIAYSFLYMMSLLQGDIRWQAGGYDPYAGKLQALLGSAGLLFGAAGLQGALDSKVQYLKAFTQYQSVKLVVLVLVFLLDQRLLVKCEDWKAGMPANLAMDHLAPQGLCPTARLSYTVGFAVDFVVMAYFWKVSKHFMSLLEANPSCIMNFGGDAKFNSEVKYYDPTVGEPGQYMSGQAP
eukprot:TRINITY_DN2452_c0_g1_i1.p1 TRINITY_DN2452_c0_g1~~TRINITY_DN2452_c0_g1_i1.p1  ORF type:complete len:232 (-),score=38.61 TRINITY_DN2452_c0_g1_i1:61-684(-)